MSGFNPNFHINVSVSNLYIPRLVCLVCCRKICGTDTGHFLFWEYINGISVAVHTNRTQSCQKNNNEITFYVVLYEHNISSKKMQNRSVKWANMWFWDKNAPAWLWVHLVSLQCIGNLILIIFERPICNILYSIYSIWLPWDWEAWTN
jgi:hypothetical protein